MVVVSSNDVTTEFVGDIIVGGPTGIDAILIGIGAKLAAGIAVAVVVVAAAGAVLLFFCRTHANTLSLNSTGYVEHKIVASRNRVACDVRSACGKCCNTKSRAN